MPSWSGRARMVLPAGVAHDSRWAKPPKPYFENGRGAVKWDVDGHEYIDFVQGNGSLLLGLAPDQVTRALQAAVGRGTHLGGNHPGEVEWAERVVELVPCAERVRFTSSGTEASLLALRLARVATGRNVVARLEGHFHGWHDYMLVGLDAPYDVPMSPGIPPAALQDVAVVEQTPEDVEARLSRGDVAALICEPSGPRWGTAPLTHEALAEFRNICDRHGTVLIFDEVITGFRAAPGGMQESARVTPDLCVLGKILAGGMPGGAVAGQELFFEPLEMLTDPVRARHEHVYHPGTFNANPISAAAACATLDAVRAGAPKDAEQKAVLFRASLAEAFGALDRPATVYGQSSWFHVLPGQDRPPRTYGEAKSVASGGLIAQGERMLLAEGIDNLRMGGFVGTAHEDQHLERAVAAFVNVVGRLYENQEQ